MIAVNLAVIACVVGAKHFAKPRAAAATQAG